MGKIKSMLSKAKPYLLIVGLQFGFAGVGLFSVVSMKHGMNRFVFTAYRNAFAALCLAPFAFFFERKVRPKMTLQVCLLIIGLGFLEPVFDQGFTLLGMKYTSATFTSAVQNSVPSITFVFALIFRLERVKMKERGSQAKVIGTIITFGGALLMTVYKGPVIHFLKSGNASQQQQAGGESPHKHWVLGTLFLLIGCVAWSSFFIIQSITLRKYPAEMSLACLICFVGSLQSGAVAFAMEHHSAAWSLAWDYRLFAPLYTGVVGSGIAYYFQGLVLQSKGPVFLTAFNPLCLVILAIFGPFFLSSEQLHLGSLIGAAIIAVGLYSVVWGKTKDNAAHVTPSLMPTESTSTQQHLPITNTNTDTSSHDNIPKLDHNVAHHTTIHHHHHQTTQ